VEAAVNHGAGHPKPYCGNPFGRDTTGAFCCLTAEILDKIFESGEVASGVTVLENRLQSACFGLPEQGQVAFGAANVARQNHVYDSIRRITGL
jgi:hypothetical protein